MVVSVVLVRNFIPCTRAGPQNSFLDVLQYVSTRILIRSWEITSTTRILIRSCQYYRRRTTFLFSKQRRSGCFTVVCLIPTTADSPLPISNLNTGGTLLCTYLYCVAPTYFAHRRRPFSQRWVCSGGANSDLIFGPGSGFLFGPSRLPSHSRSCGPTLGGNWVSFRPGWLFLDR
jgi:hypothetical protein